MLMTAIGEGDEVCGVIVSIRNREDVVLVWNTDTEVAAQTKIFDCVGLLLPDTNFLSTFYKRELLLAISNQTQKPLLTVEFLTNK
jgi:hypothetical protein